MSLVTLEMVRAVRVSTGGIEVDLVMNCPGCPAGEAALTLARKTLRTLNGGAVRLILLPQVWIPPWELLGNTEHM
jgi:metal-sulfur cluster biosynthetic enzyme